MLGEMASGVAHDFNNALTAILGTVEWLLQHSTFDEEVRGDLQTIRTAAMDAAEYVRHLQLAARPRPAHDSSELIDLADVARQMPPLLRPRWSELTRRGLPFDVVVEADAVPPVCGRTSEIRELLLNLLFNGADAMQRRGGQLTIRVEHNAGRITLSVRDDGDGIPEDVRARIFEPFFTTKGAAGSGMGLGICRRIAQQHGGTLEIESQVGHGTTASLTLPVAHLGDTTHVSEPRTVARSVAAQRVLLIDDQSDVLESVGEMLGALGHSVSLAPDGRTGLELLSRQTFDVVMTDLGMPGMNGLEVAKRARDVNPKVPVVLLTGWGALYEDAQPEAVSFVVSKPLTLTGLRETMERAVLELAA